MKEINTNQGTLKRNFLELTEMKQILLKAQIFFDEVSNVDSSIIYCRKYICIFWRHLMNLCLNKKDNINFFINSHDMAVSTDKKRLNLKTLTKVTSSLINLYSYILLLINVTFSCTIKQICG